MQIENHLPVAVVVSTYDVGDFLFWLPCQVEPLAPGATATVTAHDRGRCKVKIEIVDGPRTWVLDPPDDAIYREHDTVRIGHAALGEHASPPSEDLESALQDFLRRNHDHVVPADDWIPGSRRPTGDPMVRAVMIEHG